MGTFRKNIGTALIFTWIGFVAAISFMEAWLKFRAPGVTLPIGLGIGRLVFSALNKVEWVLLLVVCVSLFPGNMVRRSIKIWLSIPVLIVILQTIWMLPFLDMRAEIHIKGESVPPSSMHFYYVIAEVVKIITLLWSGVLLFRRERTGF